ncbi:hypothetical protein ACWDZ4_30440 [Streptomyces sp. NPDC003016]
MTVATYQYVDLPDASVVTTRALLAARENIGDTVAARAMMCIYGGAGFGKTLAVNTCLRELEPGEDVRRVTFRTRPTARAVRYELFTALDLAGEPPRHLSEFDGLLKTALSERPRTFLVDEGPLGRRQRARRYQRPFRRVVGQGPVERLLDRSTATLERTREAVRVVLQLEDPQTGVGGDLHVDAIIAATRVDHEHLPAVIEHPVQQRLDIPVKGRLSDAVPLDCHVTRLPSIVTYRYDNETVRFTARPPREDLRSVRPSPLPPRGCVIRPHRKIPRHCM